jgi:F-type H+-transporting ATPase subunit b
MLELLAHDTSVWVAISFAVFAFFAYKLGRKSVLGSLDGKIEAIRTEIQTAESLRIEAQELLAQYQRKQRDAEKEADLIITQAKASAKRIQEAAEIELVETMNRREVQLQQRLKRIEDNAVSEIQAHAAELAVAATTEIINRTLDEKTAQALADTSAQSISKHLN